MALGGLALAASGDKSADRELGQADFQGTLCNRGTSNATANRLCDPTAVAVGPIGRFFVADTDNARVLSWPSAKTVTNGQNANLVFGQPNFSSHAPGNGARGACAPMGWRRMPTAICGWPTAA